jgi:hypothetical protein
MEYLVGSVFLALFCWTAGRSLYLRWWGIATVGTIVALALETDGDGNTYQPVVAFTTQDKIRIEAKSLYGTAEAGTYFRIGEHVPIRYAAHNPTCFAIEGYEVSAVLWLFFFAVGGVAMLWWKITN